MADDTQEIIGTWTVKFKEWIWEPVRYSVQFQVKFADFLLSVTFWNCIKTGVVERFVVFQHTMDSMEQFTHDSTNAL